MNIEINKLENALNPFNKEMLANELNNYIVQECQIDIKNSKEINIKGNLTNEEKILLEKAIHNHYANLTRKLKQVDKYDNYFRLILLVIGTVLILISEETASFLRELFLIAGWIFIWEMLYDAFFNQINRKRKANIYKKLSTCKINFIK